MSSIEFHPIFAQYKDEIWEIHKSINNVKGANEQTAQIFFLFLIHRRLTQKQIRMLTHFSLGFISETLKYLIDYKILSRDSIEGTHEYQYTLQSNFMGMGRILMEEMRKEIRKMQSIYHTMLGQLLTPENDDPESTPLVLSLKRMLTYLDDYDSIILKFTGNMIYKNSTSPKIPLEEISLTNDRFKAQFNEILNLFTDSKIMPYKKASQRKVFGAMILAGTFSKKELSRLTGLSYKTFHEYFNFFKNTRQLLLPIKSTKSSEIQEQSSKKKKKHPAQKFTLKPFDQIISRNIANTSSEVKSKVLRLLAIRKELLAQKDEMESMNGYQEILRYIDDYLEITKSLF